MSVRGPLFRLWAIGLGSISVLFSVRKALKRYNIKTSKCVMKEPLRAFQKQFVRRALAPEVDIAALSIPRGNGKSWLAAHLLERCLTPGNELHVPGSEYLLCAASIEQARLVYRFIRTELEETGEYSFIDSTTRIGITHKASNTRLRVLSSNGKTAMGIVNCPLLVADEPGSWESVGGTLMYDAIITALGKPNSPMRTKTSVRMYFTDSPARAGIDDMAGFSRVQRDRFPRTRGDRPSRLFLWCWTW